MEHLAEQVREQAVQWLLRLENEPNSLRLQRELESWLQESEVHQKIFNQVRLIWLASGEAEAPGQPSLPAFSLMFVLVLFLAFWAARQPDLVAPAGGITRTRLPGGSVISLEPGSAINVDIGPQARRIELLRGAVHAEVDSSQLKMPFVVETEAGQVRALGTRFSVRWISEGAQVQVYESIVELRPDGAREVSLKLQAGEAGMLYPEAAERHVMKVQAQPEWLAGRLTFQQEALGQVLATLQRYDSRWQWVALAESDLEAPFSGVLVTDQLDHAYAVLAQSMGLAIDHSIPGIIRIQKKSD